MPIELSNPITVTTQTRTFDKVWLRTVNINAEDPAKPVTAYISASPYSSADGSLMREQMAEVSIPDVFAACQDNPALAYAVEAIYSAVQTLLAAQGAFVFLAN